MIFCLKLLQTPSYCQIVVWGNIRAASSCQKKARLSTQIETLVSKHPFLFYHHFSRLLYRLSISIDVNATFAGAGKGWFAGLPDHFSFKIFLWHQLLLIGEMASAQ
jgi:hypothetical protein